MEFIDSIEKQRLGRQVVSSVTISNWYYSSLRKVIEEFHKSVIRGLREVYEDNEKRIERNGIVGDIQLPLIEKAQPRKRRTPAKKIYYFLSKVRVDWGKVFDDFAEKVTDKFFKKVKSYAHNALKSSFRNAGERANSIRFDNAKEEDIVSAMVQENVALIKTIPQQYLDRVQAQVNEAVIKGYDFGTLYDNLKKDYNITERRARTIARDQLNKATQSIAVVNCLSAGVTHGRWKHNYGGSMSFRDSHVHADGKVFELNKGLYIDGEYIFPGEKINCKCSFEPIFGDVEQ